MEESDLVLQLRTSFHLGNNYKVIELIKEHSDVTLTTNKDLALSLLCRSCVKMGKNFVQYIEGINLQGLKEDIQLAFTYLAPLNKEVYFAFKDNSEQINRFHKMKQNPCMLSLKEV